MNTAVLELKDERETYLVTPQMRAAIPGEIYPELVYGKIQEPIDPGADFQDAAKEKSVAELLPVDKWLLFGMANDEIGYIIPKRQWDRRKPFAYGRKKSWRFITKNLKRVLLRV